MESVSLSGIFNEECGCHLLMIVDEFIESCFTEKIKELRTHCPTSWSTKCGCLVAYVSNWSLVDVEEQFRCIPNQTRDVERIYKNTFEKYMTAMHNSGEGAISDFVIVLPAFSVFLRALLQMSKTKSFFTDGTYFEERSQIARRSMLADVVRAAMEACRMTSVDVTRKPEVEDHESVSQVDHCSGGHDLAHVSKQLALPALERTPHRQSGAEYTRPRSVASLEEALASDLVRSTASHSQPHVAASYVSSRVRQTASNRRAMSTVSSTSDRARSTVSSTSDRVRSTTAPSHVSKGSRMHRRPMSDVGRQGPQNTAPAPRDATPNVAPRGSVPSEQDPAVRTSPSVSSRKSTTQEKHDDDTSMTSTQSTRSKPSTFSDSTRQTSIKSISDHLTVDV